MAIPQISLETLTSQGTKPGDLYTLQFFKLIEKLWDEIVKNAPSIEEKIDAGTGLLHATCPDPATREHLWREYQKEKEREDTSQINASILTIGSLFNYISDTVEITDNGPTANNPEYRGKPKEFYMIEVFRLVEKYWDDVIGSLPPEDRLEAVTALMHATCTNKDKMRSLWSEYISEKKNTNELNASVLSIGALFEFVSEKLQFTEESYGGF